MKTQQEQLLEALKQGSVNSYYATYTLRIKQAPTRIRELKDLGYAITSVNKPDRSVDWELWGSPKTETPRPIARDGIWKFENNTARFVPIEEMQPRQESLI